MSFNEMLDYSSIKRRELKPSEVQSELKRHKDIVSAAIDYLMENTAGRIKWDGIDPQAGYYKRLKEKTEKYYRKSDLAGLEKLQQKIMEERRHVSDLRIGPYIKEKTGYTIDIFANLPERINGIIQRGQVRSEKEYRDVVVMANVLHQTGTDPGGLATLDRLRLAYDERKDNRQRKSAKEDIHFSNQFSNTISPNSRYRLVVSESSINGENATTQVSLETQNGGASIYIAKGINLGIKTYWKDNHTVSIETKSDYEVGSVACRQLQIFDDVFAIDIIET